MKLTGEYLEQAKKTDTFSPFEGSRHVGWKSPSNIALIKYWGKRENQIPQNPSLSFALQNSFTETAVEYSTKLGNQPKLSFSFEGNSQPGFEERIKKTIATFLPYMPFLAQLDLKIESVNSFPHSSGIASSASAMSALAFCMVSIEKQLFGTLTTSDAFMQKASFLSRLGSGSACRSVYGNYSVWGYDPIVKHSTNEAAIPVLDQTENKLGPLGDAVMIVSSKPKKVSSSAGHGLMNNHPFAETRYEQARCHLKEIIKAIGENNEKDFIRIVEHEALTLHALMMSSENGFTLLAPNTWSIIEKVRKYRDKSGLFVAFTLDAGPNVHLIYKISDREKVLTFIKDELRGYCENGYWIDDRMGSGPVELN
ncbi:MAG: diphosphomevalonate/mevalonate 3,5-bisphosphate decarboxylase family protein [Bacteroidales bacterium]